MTSFTEIVKKSTNQLVSDLISERLKSALEKETDANKKEAEKALQTPILDEREIVTTEEEKEGFLIIKSILRKKFNSSRIIGRDTLSYFGILLDDNNRKPLCRLWFNGVKKYISIFDEGKKEIKLEITGLDDIFGYADQILSSVEHFEKEMIK